MKQAVVFDGLHTEGLISDASYEKIRHKWEQKLLPVHWELRMLLYLGVLLLTTGLGILVYKNIDSIGHQIILLFIASVCTGCFFYCATSKLPFSTGKVAAPNSFFDYILLLGCCTLITFLAYLQFQFHVFGDRYGLAVFFPMLILFFCAYFFDHLGILSMAIVNLAAWVGITITPLHLLESDDFNSGRVIFTGLALGILLLGVAWMTLQRDIKKHFEFTYANFGTHLLLISCTAGMFNFNSVYFWWFLLLAFVCLLFYWKALRDKSFYFILVITLYAFVGLSYVILRLLSQAGGGIATFYLGFIYFIIASIVLIIFLIRTNKKIKAI